MALASGRVFPCQREGAEICKDQRIDPRVVQPFQMFGKLRNLIVARHGVDRHMHTHAAVVSKPYCLRQLLRGKVSRKGAHAEAGAGKVDGIRTVKHRHLQFLHVARRSEQFGFLFHDVCLSTALKKSGMRRFFCSFSFQPAYCAELTKLTCSR